MVDYKRAAQILGISLQALRNKVSAGEVEYTKDGRRVYFDKSYIESLAAKTTYRKVTLELSEPALTRANRLIESGKAQDLSQLVDWLIMQEAPTNEEI